MSHRVVAGLFMLLASVGFANTADAAKLGSPFRVNTETGGDQDSPAIAGLTNGNFVIVWKNFGQSGQMGGMYFRLYGPGGIPKVGETRVNSATTTVGSRPSVAPLNNGGFVVAYNSPDSSSGGVWVRRFNANGVALGPAVRANTTTASNQSTPSVSRLTDGGFIVMWTSAGNQDGDGTGVYGQRFDAAGGKVEGEFLVNTEFTQNDQTTPKVAGLANGGFVGVWNSFDQDHDNFGIYAQRYNSTADPILGHFRANSQTVGAQFGATIAAMSQSKFIIAWHSFGQDGSGWGVYAQRYAANGTTLGNEFRVNFKTLGDQMNPAAAGLAGGAFVVVWDAANKDGSGKAIVGRQFNADGTPDGGEILVNTFKPGDQIKPAVARLNNGDYVVAWESDGQDGSGIGVYAQRFRP